MKAKRIQSGAKHNKTILMLLLNLIKMKHCWKLIKIAADLKSRSIGLKKKLCKFSMFSQALDRFL